MAHVQKNNRSAAGHLFDHYARNTEEEQYKYLFRQNKSIDPDRTYLNYNLAPEKDKNQNEILKDRLSEVKCLKRKDVNVMCSWVLTLPKDFPAEREKEFFGQAYEFLEKRYGKENVISSYVHKDETTPHMHFCFVPVVKDKKTGREKVSAFELLTRKELIKFHPDLDRHLERYFGFEVGVLNEATKEGNQTVAELKQNTIASKTKEMQQELNKLDLTVREKINTLEVLNEKLNALNRKIGLSEKLLTQFDNVESIGQKSLVGNKITMSQNEFTQLKEMAKGFMVLRERIKPIVEENQNLKNTRDSIIKLNVELGKLQSQFDDVTLILNSDPDLLKRFKQQEKYFSTVTQHRQMNLDGFERQ